MVRATTRGTSLAFPHCGIDHEQALTILPLVNSVECARAIDAISPFPSMVAPSTAVGLEEKKIVETVDLSCRACPFDQPPVDANFRYKTQVIELATSAKSKHNNIGTLKQQLQINSVA